MLLNCMKLTMAAPALDKAYMAAPDWLAPGSPIVEKDEISIIVLQIFPSNLKRSVLSPQVVSY